MPSSRSVRARTGHPRCSIRDASAAVEAAVEAIFGDLRTLFSSAIGGDAKALQWDSYPRQDSIILELPMLSYYRPLSAPTTQVCMYMNIR